MIAELVIQEVVDEVLVYDQRHLQAQCLNQRAAAIWRLCDGRLTPADIAGRLSAAGTPMTEEAVWHH